MPKVEFREKKDIEKSIDIAEKESMGLAWHRNNRFPIYQMEKSCKKNVRRCKKKMMWYSNPIWWIEFRVLGLIILWVGLTCFPMSLAFLSVKDRFWSSL